LTGGRYSEVVVRTGLTVFKKLFFSFSGHRTRARNRNQNRNHDDICPSEKKYFIIPNAINSLLDLPTLHPASLKNQKKKNVKNNSDCSNNIDLNRSVASK
jgi:hypothetical protein